MGRSDDKGVDWHSYAEVRQRKAQTFHRRGLQLKRLLAVSLSHSASLFLSLSVSHSLSRCVSLPAPPPLLSTPPFLPLPALLTVSRATCREPLIT